MIPKKIHYCWVGGNPLPEKDRKCIESWRRACPDWEIVRWDETNYDFHKKAYMGQAYDAGKWGFVPDYARLDIVSSEGGIYLDTDVELLRSPDQLLDYSGYMGWSQDGFANPGLGFGAEAGNATLKHLMAAYDRLSFFNEDGSLNLTASPHYATDSLAELGFSKRSEVQIIDGFAVLPSDYLDPLNPDTGRLEKTENTLSAHLYFGSWLSERDRYQKELRRNFNKKGIPDSLAWPLSRGVAYLKHEGLAKSIGRALRGPQK